MRAYGRLVTVGSKMHVQDGIIDTLGVPAYRHLRPGPVPAIKHYLAEHPEFELDHDRIGRFPITFHPMGWLTRVRERRSALRPRAARRCIPPTGCRVRGRRDTSARTASGL